MVTDPERIHALLDGEILVNVEKPARYVGGETNAVRKDPTSVEVAVALLFPDVYDVGMSHIGYQILYGILNGLDWAAAERAYAVWPDMQARMREHRIPLYTLESFRPVRGFDIVGFSLQYELLCTNVLAMLDLAGIPIGRDERTQDDPVVIAGGPGAAAPEPMAGFIDLFFTGDGEEAIVQFAELVREMKAAGAGRDEIILEAARRIAGVYAPAHYRVTYREDGTLSALEPTTEGIPNRVRAQKLDRLEDGHFPTDLLVPLAETVHDRIALEIMRGCTRGCRFCQAGMLRRPVRPRPIEQLLAIAEEAYRKTGHSEIALTSLSSSDYPDFRRLLQCMGEFTAPRGVSLSLSSLRVSDQLELLPEVLGGVRKSGLTVAPEAGTDRLRRVINKDVTNEELLAGARAAFEAGWRAIKLYFMMGLPSETDEDVEAIAELCEQVSDCRREVSNGPGNVTASIAWFVPKPHTPFQWEPMVEPEVLLKRRRIILDRKRRKNIRYNFHDVETSLLEAVICRGDPRVGRVIRRVYEAGGQFDAWTEHFSFERWRKAFEEEGLDMAFYAHRMRPTDETLPWDHIDFGLRREFLLAEREKAFRAEMTPDCRLEGCTLCGVCTGVLDG